MLQFYGRDVNTANFDETSVIFEDDTYTPRIPPTDVRTYFVGEDIWFNLGCFFDSIAVYLWYYFEWFKDSPIWQKKKILSDILEEINKQMEWWEETYGPRQYQTEKIIGQKHYLAEMLNRGVKRAPNDW